MRVVFRVAGPSAAKEIPLPNMRSSVVAKVVEFCQHNRTEPMTKIPQVCASTHTYTSPIYSLGGCVRIAEVGTGPDLFSLSIMFRTVHRRYDVALHT